MSFPALFFLCALVSLGEAAELPRYEIDATVDTAAHRITATQTVIYTNNSSAPLPALYFHIYPHRTYTRKEICSLYRYAGYFKVNPFPEGFQAGDLKLTSASSRSMPLTYTIEGTDRTILKVDLASPLAPGASIDVTLAFTVDIPHCFGRFGWHEGVITLTRWYPTLAVFDDEGWHNYPFYIYHQPFYSDAARYRLRLTVPRDETVVSGCSVVREEEQADGRKIVILESDAPMRDLGLGISKRFRCFLFEDEGCTIRSYYLDDTRSSAEKAAQHAAGIMKFYAGRFGSYPYKVFSIAPAYLGFGGDQSSGLIFIDTRLFHLPGFLRRYFDFLISHETGHQWFYNIIGSDEYREMFIDEGMNSYWLLRHMEATYGENANVLELPAFLSWLIPNFTFRNTTAVRYLYLVKNGYDRPVIGALSGFTQPITIFALAYGKGASVLQMLEKKIGREAFDAFVARYAREYRFKNIRLADVERIAGEESGRDLSSFFEQWLRTAKSCDFAIKKVSPATVTVENRRTLQMPVSVRLQYADGTSETKVWDGKGSVSFPVQQARKLERVDIDPDNAVILDLDRTNNHWPRKMNFRAVPMYFFAYEIPVMLDREAYQFTAGPSIGSGSLGVASSVQEPYDDILKMSALYDFGDEAVDTTLGYEFRHLSGRHNALGFEFFNYDSRARGNTRTGGKVYFRRDLWPLNQSVLGVNDHATLYMIRDRELNRESGLYGAEDVRNMRYRKKDETILGVTGSLGRFGPFEDPIYGWRFIPTAETAGHFLGGTEAFWRTSAELQKYHLVSGRLQHKIAVRGKIGWGEASDKGLFQLGGAQGLRGYDAKTVEGAHMALASAEYRVPLSRKTRHYFLDNVLCLHTIQTVGFFDIGKAWYSSYDAGRWKKDAGAGLRFHFDLAGLLEQAVVRLDVAHAVDDPGQDTHVWLGINQAF
ncbi:MAG: M1 family aminopeptidase [Candidatus Omnitrophica bacterium]|nr:M1 family aminopeptidase [Candidatus Omnitrophota bacterium]